MLLFMQRMRFAEWLEYRSAIALTLRQFDEDARRMKVKRLDSRAAGERTVIENTLRAYGGEPWPYSPVKDNSWIADV